ncbi:hypothetical protein [Pseudomonas sp. CJQ_13]|uniref:hypothetical protein n=1 Tax=Pseudomonas sp. CJQ_13 TaxID=3367170 RepID=UPI00370A36C9
MIHNDDQHAAVEAYERKQRRARPEFLNQETLDGVAHRHAKDLIELGAKSSNSHLPPTDSKE